MLEQNQDYKYHFNELRYRLFFSFIALLFITCLIYIYSNYLLEFIISPLQNSANNSHTGYELIYTDLVEPFVVYIKLSLYFGFYLSLPFIAFQIYQFLAPGLSRREKKLLKIFFILGHLLFYLAIIFVYNIVLPRSIGFFLNISSEDKFNLYARMSEYIDLSMLLINCFAVTFQLPIIMTICVLLSLIELKSLKNGRRIAVVVIFTLAAVITPPDIFSQIILALPLILLYEISIFSCQFLHKKE